jgi:uncharacterized Zn finger protein
MSKQLEQQPTKDPRYSRGMIIAASRTVKHIRQTNVWKVESEQDDNKFYHVTLYDDDIKCDCPDYERRQSPCKHVYAVVIMETT